MVGCRSPDLMERSKCGGGGTREEQEGGVGGGVGLSCVNERPPDTGLSSPLEELVPLPGWTAEVAICLSASRRDLDTGT